MVIGFDGFDDIVSVQEKRAFSICENFGAEDLGKEAGLNRYEINYGEPTPTR